MFTRTKRPPEASESRLLPIERELRFIVDQLFRGDLAVWDKQLELFYPRTGIRQRERESQRA